MASKVWNLTAAILSVAAAGTACSTSTGSGGYYYAAVPSDGSANVDTDTTSTVPNDSAGASDTTATSNPPMKVDSIAESLATATLTLPKLAAPGVFGSTTVDGSWNVVFTTTTGNQMGKAVVNGRTGTITFPDKTVSIDDCPVVGAASYVVEVAESGDIALVWHVVEIKGSASCLNGVKGVLRRLLFPMRRVAAGVGQFGALAGEWDALGFGTYLNGQTSCRLRIGPSGMDGCDQLMAPVLAWQGGSTVSGRFGAGNGKVEWAATQINNAPPANGLFGLTPTVAKTTDWADLAGVWGVQFANWWIASTGNADVGSRYATLSLPPRTVAGCEATHEHFGVELAGSGDLGILWHTTAASSNSSFWCEGSASEVIGAFRRVKAGGGQFASLAGSWELYERQELSKPTLIEVDSSGIRVVKDSQELGNGKQTGPAVSGMLMGFAEYTAVKK